jgi:hypothetical protein
VKDRRILVPSKPTPYLEEEKNSPPSTNTVLLRQWCQAVTAGNRYNSLEENKEAFLRMALTNPYTEHLKKQNAFRYTVTTFFASGLFMNHLPPSPLKITLGSFRIFSKILGDIRKSRCTTRINNTDGKIAAGINDNGSKFCHQFRWCC